MELGAHLHFPGTSGKRKLEAHCPGRGSKWHNTKGEGASGKFGGRGVGKGILLKRRQHEGSTLPGKIGTGAYLTGK
jgi:hypothetical protein